MYLREKLNQLKEKIYTWEETSTRREKFKIILITIILPLFLFYKFYYLPSKTKITQIKEDINKLELEIRKLESSVRRVKIIEAEVERRKTFYDEIQKILPTEKEIPQLLKTVSELARENKLEILRFAPRQEETKDYYNSIPFDMELKGYFYDIIKFLNNVERLPRLVTLNNIEVLPQQKEEKLIIKCNFITYKYTKVPLNQTQERR